MLGWLVETISRKMPVETDFTKPLDGSWYISPTQHGFEILSLTVFFYVLFMITMKKVCHPGSPQWKALAHYDNTLKITFLEKILTVLALLSWGLIVVYKYQRNELICLLQPCHLNLLVLTFILIFPKKYSLTHIVYNIYIYGLWGTTMAIAQPDMRGYDKYLEAENFWLEHILLLFAPVLLMFTDRYVLWPASFTVGLMSFCLNALYNMTILACLGLLTGLNLNYLLSPPPGLLEMFGVYYRAIVLIVCLALSFLIRCTYIEVAAYLTIKLKAVIRYLKAQEQKSS